MKKKSSIIKLSIIGVIVIIGLVLSFVPMNFGLTTFNSFGGSIKLGLDLKGGVYAVYEMQEGESMDNLASRMDGTKTRLENLLIKKGYSEATVVKEGTTRLRVEVPDVDSPENIFKIIGKPASLRFELVNEGGTNQIVLRGENILKAESNFLNGEWVVSLKLDADGTKAFGDATAANIGKQMSIISTVDGTDTVISSPKIESAITGGEAYINGMASEAEAKNLADQITSGQFEVKLSLLESSTVSATLGEQALFLGIIAGLIGLLLVMVFLCLIYRGFGLTACISLLVYGVLMMFFLAIIPLVQLTLPGIAGIILSLGMAVDGNVIIYERIKDEYKNGKSILASSHAGFKRATIAIIDSNVTTIIAAIVLFIFGTGSIQGFAITLLIGIVIAMFTSLIVTRKLVKYFLGINSTDAKFYNLKRGKGFENVEASKSGIEDESKKPESVEKSDDEKNKGVVGGLSNENI